MGELSSDGALAGIRDWDSPDLRAHIRDLIDSNEPGVEAIILGGLDDAGPVHPLLCRVLAERDPNRTRRSRRSTESRRTPRTGSPPAARSR